jgi:hypothetical protein
MRLAARRSQALGEAGKRLLPTGAGGQRDTVPAPQPRHLAGGHCPGRKAARLFARADQAFRGRRRRVRDESRRGRARRQDRGKAGREDHVAHAP